MISFFPTRQIALQLGPLAIHWYGLMYLLAFLCAWCLLPRLAKYRSLVLDAEKTGSLLTHSIIGTLLGGRLGYVLFYAPEYFGDHPWEIMMVWHGGMSFHGGLIGVLLGIFLFCRKFTIPFWRLADILVVPVAFGLAFGRIGNFINQELYGTVTSLPWGIEIPGVFGLRHPTPIYAMLKNLLIAILCFTHLRFSRKTSGMTAGLFLVLYGILRFLVEFVRAETASGFTIGSLYLTRGQLLTIPVFLAGLLIVWMRQNDKGNSD